MSVLAIGISDLPVDAIGILIILLVSFLGWLKNRFSGSGEGASVDEEDDPMRDVIWRRQVGETESGRPWTDESAAPAPPPLPPEPAPEIRAEPVPESARRSSVPDLSEKQEQLARAFERNLAKARRPGRTAGHLAELRTSLRAPDATRRAVLLGEILGPPVSQRRPDERHP